VLTAKEIGIMARIIDDSKPLSAEDRQWLKDWGRGAEIERIDQIHGVTDGGASQEDSPAPGERTTEEALAQLLRENGVDPGDNPLEALVGVLTRSAGDPLGHGQQVVAPGESGSSASGEPTGEDTGDDGDDGGDYTGPEWDKAALQEELGKRELSKSGNKAELIARLREDDADEE
jgi:hypothetical protein